jgi:glycosyltransferase involved in cell wall biosynthesis
MIPYGADEVTSADSSHLELYDLRPRRYSVIISRPEPENSIFEMVAAFSRRRRNHTLVVLGDFQPDSNYFHRCVTDVASDEVIFPGAIYDQELVKALRFYACFYLHGHTVGGTNPSLVEAMGAGCAVIAHDNEFNRWVVGDGAVYFGGEDECAALFDLMLEDSDQIAELGRASLRRFRERFTWDRVLQEYEELLDEWYPTD